MITKSLLDYNSDCLPTRYNIEPDQEWLSRLLAQKAITEKLCFSSQMLYGKADYNELLKELKELGAVPVHHSPNTYDKEPSICLVLDDTVFRLFVSEIDEDKCALSIQSVNDDRFNELCAKFKPMLKKIKPGGKVYVLIPSPEGIQVESMGVASTPFLKDNYRPEAVDGFNQIVADINNSNPIGRLSILDGMPGTGKTHMLRSLMGACPKAMFIMIPANMTADLGGPSLISCLLNIKEKDKTLILCIEDADSCLTSRAADNMSAISSLLNISDGIIGNMIDIRIICTTNADIKDIDSAILRPGRLSARVEVGLLDADHATRRFKELTGEEHLFKPGTFVSLGELYLLTKKGGNNDFNVENPYYSPNPLRHGQPTKRVVGFSSNNRPMKPVERP